MLSALEDASVLVVSDENIDLRSLAACWISESMVCNTSSSDALDVSLVEEESDDCCIANGGGGIGGAELAAFETAFSKSLLVMPVPLASSAL